MDIQVDDDVKQMIMEQGCDYRICTACYGPALVKTDVKAPKPTDIAVPIGDNTLYISRIQAQYINRVTMDMLYNEYEIDSCPAFYVRSRY